jgi:type IV secretory pathway VirB4 component
MIMMLMTAVFKKRDREGELKKRNRDTFNNYHGFQSFVKQARRDTNHRYSHKSNCVAQTIITPYKTTNIKITSAYVDFATNTETRLNIRNILLDMQTALSEVTKCVKVKLAIRKINLPKPTTPYKHHYENYVHLITSSQSSQMYIAHHYKHALLIITNVHCSSLQTCTTHHHKRTLLIIIITNVHYSSSSSSSSVKTT